MKHFSDVLSILFLIICLTVLSACRCDRRANEHTISSGYPLTIETYDGYSGSGRVIMQEFDGPPQRIVATSIPTIDNLIFLGLQDKIVGIGNIFGEVYPPYAPVYDRLPRLTDGAAYPSKEAVLGAHPDIIIGWGSLFGDDAIGSAAKWQERGIHTYPMINTVPTAHIGPRKVEYFLIDLHNLAKIFHVEDETKDRIAALEERLQKINEASDALKDDDRPRIATVQQAYGNEYMARSAIDLTSDIIRLAGGRSLDDMEGSRRSVEYLIKTNPDIILLINSPTSPGDKKRDALKSNRILRHVSAIKYDRFLIIDQSTFYCGSMRTLDDIERLRKEISAMKASQ